ncbi:MAG: hypothetical protein HUU20_22225 [Pirellulales bacterium]|nr:hypothetical protein [Pirellulales bacterium]
MRCACLRAGILALMFFLHGGWPVWADDRVAYAPDIVGVERMFLVALRAPVDAPEIKVTVPDSVALFDFTRLPAKSEIRKFYFRSLRPAKRAEIRFAHPAGEIVVPLEIWSLDDLRTFRQWKGVAIPRRWPLGEALPELKQGQTITTENVKRRMKGQGSPGSQWLEVSDEVIWSLQPDSTIPRWHWVNIAKGCPLHGPEIYRKTAYYPWTVDMGIPHRWKIRCPIDGAVYPSNDFANGDMTSGDYPDDGIGGGFEQNGVRYGFIAEICQAYCHQMLNVAPACADGFLATGDVRYVHKALVAMSRLAVEWAYLATMTQHRHRNTAGQVERLGPAPFSEGPCLNATGMTVYSISMPGHQWAHAEAYDKIWPAIDQDQEIVPFLKGKGLNVRTGEDVRRFIEENLFAVWMQASMDTSCASNVPYSQRGFVRMAEALNYSRGAEFMDALYDVSMIPDNWSAEHRAGMRSMVANGFFRDGAAYEATGGYNGMHVSALGPILESIEHLRQLRPEIYPEAKYPNLAKSRRYHNVFDFDMENVLIDRCYPSVGDSGSHPRYNQGARITWESGGAAAYEHAYHLFHDPKFAWALANAPGWQPSLDFPYTREQIEAEAAKWPDDWNDASSLHDGYGLAILRGGKGDAKRALWMMYGRARCHVHDDIMDIGLAAFQSTVLAHLGYPRQWSSWEGNWMTHNLARQIPPVNLSAAPQLFADAGPVHLAEAHAQAFVDQVAAGKGYSIDRSNWQRRMLAVIDVNDSDFYCLDLYRIHGGVEHWWSFHVQEGDFSTQGLALKKQDGGTLAGPEVSYGDADWIAKHGAERFAFPYLYNVARDTPAGTWAADWALKDADGLHFRLTVPGAEGAELVVCDGKSPAGGSPYEMKWLLLHKSGSAPVRTQVLGLMEMYKENPVIRSVKPLTLSGADEGGLPACAAVVELEDRTDTIFASADGTVERTAPGGFEFAGRFGLYRQQRGGAVQIVLVGGTKLTRDGTGITLDSHEFRGTITRVDRATETITVSPAPPDLDAMIGRRIFISNSARRIASKVLAAKRSGADAELGLDLDSRIGAGRVTGVADGRVLTDTDFVLNHFRYYHGARLVNAARTVEYPLIEVLSKTAALIDTDACPEAKADRLAGDFSKDSWFEVFDYGVGDAVDVPAVAVSDQAE